MNTKRQLVRNHQDLSMVERCGLIDLNRSTLYYELIPYAPEEIALFNEIDLIYTDKPYYGHRKIWQELMRRGRSIGRDRTLNYMRIMGLEAFYPHKNTSAPDKQHKLYPYLLKNLLICRPNQVWAADITYIRLAKGFCYLIAIIDWYSRYILSYRISTTLDVSFCLDALREALAKYPAPEISNTDQGSQFTSADYTELLLAREIKISMDGKGRAMDNIIIERFFRSLKHEDIYLKEYLSVAELKAGIAQYMSKYNHERLHEALDYRTPAEIYFPAETKSAPEEGEKEVIETEAFGLPERKQLLEIAV